MATVMNVEKRIADKFKQNVKTASLNYSRTVGGIYFVDIKTVQYKHISFKQYDNP